MLLARGDHWLLSVRGPDVAYAPGALGLIGGHLESADAGAADGLHALEAAARRELIEEVGVDLPAEALRYLESALFGDGTGLQLSVTFVGRAPEGLVAAVRDPAELSEVGWWTATEAAADPRCPEWLPALLGRAARLSR